jgi:hypothetical protein
MFGLTRFSVKRPYAVPSWSTMIGGLVATGLSALYGETCEPYCPTLFQMLSGETWLPWGPNRIEDRIGRNLGAAQAAQVNIMVASAEDHDLCGRRRTKTLRNTLRNVRVLHHLISEEANERCCCGKCRTVVVVGRASQFVGVRCFPSRHRFGPCRQPNLF